MVYESDEILIKRYLNGDTDAFKELFNRYRLQLFSYLIVLTHSQDEAEDLFQEIFIKVIDKLPYYREENKFKSWLFTIARNTYLDKIKSKSYINKSLEVSLDGRDEDEEPLIEKISSDLNPQKFIEEKEKINKIKTALEKISQEQKEVILLKHYGQLSFKEIAEKLNLPIGTVLARFWRGIEKLKRELSEMQ